MSEKTYTRYVYTFIGIYGRFTRVSGAISTVNKAISVKNVVKRLHANGERNCGITLIPQTVYRVHHATEEEIESMEMSYGRGWN